MKNKKSLLIILLVFVLLLVGAAVLYGVLGEKYAPEQLSTQPGITGQSSTAGSSPEPTQTQPTAEVTEDTAEPSSESATEAPSESSSENPTESTSAAVLAPNFTVYDAQGNGVQLHDFIGKPIVLNFWASWCGPCQMEMPDFNDKYLELGEEVQFLMINMTDGSRETVEGASGFIGEKGYEFPVYYDTSSEAAYTYGAYSLPTTYFIDAEGNVIAQATGAIDAETLQRGIDMIR